MTPLSARVAQLEGFSATPYWDNKQWSVGYGTRASGPNDTVDQAEASRRLQSELGSAQQSVDSFAPNLPGGMRDALSSLTYNTGTAWQNHGLGQAIRSGDLPRAQQLFLQYDKANGVFNPGLASRRAQEISWATGQPAQPMSDALSQKGNAMPQNTSALAQAFAGDPGALFGGGKKFDIGGALQSLGAGLMAPYNPKVAASLFKTAAARDNVGKYGLNPIWTKDADGNYVPLQMNSAGGAQPVQLPNNLKAVLPTTTVDLGGNGVGILRRGDIAPANVLTKAGPIGPDERPTGTGSYEPVPGSQTAGKITPRETQDKGIDRLGYNLGSLTDYYTKLNSNGGIAGPANGAGDNLNNAKAFISNSSVGQEFGRIFGTDNQSTRNSINALRPALINSIRQTTGMSARAMDSDVELKFYLQQATDPQNDYMSNLAAIDALDKQYGSGNTLKQKLPPAVYKQVQERSQALAQQHPLPSGSSATASPDDPVTMPGGITVRRIR